MMGESATRQERSTMPTRLLSGKRRAGSAPACCGRRSVIRYRHSSQGFIQSQRWTQQTFVSQFLSNRTPAYDLLVSGLIAMCVPMCLSFSFFSTGFWPCYSHSGGGTLTALFMFHELAVHLLPFRPLAALADGLADCVSVFVHKRWTSPTIPVEPHPGVRSAGRWSDRNVRHPAP